ncbi:MAG: type 4a pilus biogenesis protein PilO, partial [Candidatus Omnitrophica bacterium]|nr:type 4a pilus biogenesis protein PilO [Candidatus Omnitrophota bacterium]
MSVKEVIGKLQRVDVNDLRNIDMQQVQDSIRSKPDTLVIVLLLLGTIAGCAYLFTDYQKSEQALSEEVIKYNEQLAVAEQNKVFTQRFDKFLKEFPEKIVTDDLTDKVSSFAIDRNVNIISFSPANKLETEYTFVETIN